jgi:hypothetical protein
MLAAKKKAANVVKNKVAVKSIEQAKQSASLEVMVAFSVEALGPAWLCKKRTAPCVNRNPANRAMDSMRVPDFFTITNVGKDFD